MTENVIPVVEVEDKTVVGEMTLTPEEDTIPLQFEDKREPWEKIKNCNIRREQEFLQTRSTAVGSKVEMSHAVYEVTAKGWRKIKALTTA